MISEWKKSDWRSTETWESVNCSSGDVTITKIGETLLLVIQTVCWFLNFPIPGKTLFG